MRTRKPGGTRPLPLGLVVIYEDRDLLLVDKPAGLLTMGTDRDRERTAYWVLMDYVRKGDPKSRNRVFIVHRLDRETSGLLLLAKNEEAKRRLQEQWEATRKIYLAVVEGHPEPQADTISSYLAENSALTVYSTSDPALGKLSHTAYRVLKETEHLSLLEVDLLTGRKHQIRVHLAQIGHPIVGDRKYGAKGKGAAGRLALHARGIAFAHPWSGKPMSFSAPVPGYFHGLVGRWDAEPGPLGPGGQDAAVQPPWEAPPAPDEA